MNPERKTMDPTLIAGIAGAGASLVGGFINNAFAQKRADAQYQQALYLTG